MLDQHTPYFELRDALLAGGCPLCRLGGRAASRYIESALYEGMTVPETRERIRASQGLCRRHAWEMTGMRASVLGTAIVYRDVLKDLITALEGGGGGDGRLFGRRKASGLPEPKLPGPACAVQHDEAQRAGDVLREHLKEPELAEAYQKAGGLCLPHLRAVLGRARGGEAATLRAWQLEAWQTLRGRLDELIRKHDYRFQGEPVTAEEADAWLRSVAAVVGEPDPQPEAER